MEVTPEKVKAEETKMDAILSAIPWRCFHCDFITTDYAEALAHFGDRDDAEEFKPICKWWASISQEEKIEVLQATIKQLNQQYDENARQRTAIEGLEYQVDSIEAQIKSYKPFRGCRTIYDVFCVYDSMEGRALAADEERAKEMSHEAK